MSTTHSAPNTADEATVLARIDSRIVGPDVNELAETTEFELWSRARLQAALDGLVAQGLVEVTRTGYYTLPARG